MGTGNGRGNGLDALSMLNAPMRQDCKKDPATVSNAPVTSTTARAWLNGRGNGLDALSAKCAQAPIPGTAGRGNMCNGRQPAGTWLNGRGKYFFYHL